MKYNIFLPKHISKHVAGKHVLRNVPVRHVIGLLFKHVHRHVLKHVPDMHVPQHMYGHVNTQPRTSSPTLIAFYVFNLHIFI